jgi:hypothetical protein
MIEEIAYQGWKNNLRIRGAKTELVITLDVGPRIIRYAFHDGPNVFTEFHEHLGGAGEKEWMIRGGHRFWTAPEAPHSYDVDNRPVQWKKLGDAAVELVAPANEEFGYQKTLRVELLEGEIVRLTHRLTALGKAIEVTPWALSVMEPGGTAIVPQPQAALHPSELSQEDKTDWEGFLPDRELVLWPFTNLTDGRYAFSENFLRLSYRDGMPATKIGLKTPTGWIAYENDSLVFAKHFARDPRAAYPDRGVNLELFTNHRILEMESLAPLAPIPAGGVREHVEHWVLRQSSTSLREERPALDFFARLPKISA